MQFQFRILRNQNFTTYSNSKKSLGFVHSIGLVELGFLAAIAIFNLGWNMLISTENQAKLESLSSPHCSGISSEVAELKIKLVVCAFNWQMSLN